MTTARGIYTMGLVPSLETERDLSIAGCKFCMEALCKSWLPPEKSKPSCSDIFLAILLHKIMDMAWIEIAGTVHISGKYQLSIYSYCCSFLVGCTNFGRCQSLDWEAGLLPCGTQEELINREWNPTTLQFFVESGVKQSNYSTFGLDWLHSGCLMICLWEKPSLK